MSFTIKCNDFFCGLLVALGGALLVVLKRTVILVSTYFISRGLKKLYQEYCWKQELKNFRLESHSNTTESFSEKPFEIRYLKRVIGNPKIDRDLEFKKRCIDLYEKVTQIRTKVRDQLMDKPGYIKTFTNISERNKYIETWILPSVQRDMKEMADYIEEAFLPKFPKLRWHSFLWQICWKNFWL